MNYELTPIDFLEYRKLICKTYVDCKKYPLHDERLSDCVPYEFLTHGEFGTMIEIVTEWACAHMKSRLKTMEESYPDFPYLCGVPQCCPTEVFGENIFVPCAIDKLGDCHECWNLPALIDWERLEQQKEDT